MGLFGKYHVAAFYPDSLSDSPEIFPHRLRAVASVKTQIHRGIASFAHAAEACRESVFYNPRIPKQGKLQIRRIFPLLVKYMLTVLIYKPEFHHNTSLSYPENAFFTWVTAVPSMPITSKRQGTSVFPRPVR